MALGDAQDSYVQVAADGAGKKIDNATLTRDDATVVYRQRVVLASDDNPRQQLTLGGEDGRVYVLVDGAAFQEMSMLLMEIRDMMRLTIGA